ncbi:MAG: PAS domain-containing protein, partial [Planctomycetes bacterium]|nr:PAS domain-containing protein [Planctomycetota bacterium]
MDYRDALELLSSCGLGAILATDDYRILEVNRSGERLLHAEEPLRGKSVRVVAPFLLGGDGTIGKPAFDQYLLPCPVPAAKSLPPKTRLYVFRDATKDVRHDILEEIFNQVGEAIAVWDGSLRLLMLNAAASKLDAEV